LKSVDVFEVGEQKWDSVLNHDYKLLRCAKVWTLKGSNRITYELRRMLRWVLR